MSINVPFRRKIEVETMAHEMLTRYATWKKQPLVLPIDIDDIIEGFFKLRLEFCDLKQYLSIPDALGATWFDEKVIRIDSSLEEQEGRMVFTMAHEVGHWYMHRPIYEMNKMTVPLFGFKDSDPTAAVVCRAAGRKEPAEVQADQFAAAILAPPKLLRDAVKAITESGQMVVEDFELFNETPARNPYLRKAAKEVIDAGFNMSVEAMCYRLIDQRLVVDARPTQAKLL